MASSKMTAEPYTIHLEHSNHSLGYITGLTYKPTSPSTSGSKELCHYFGGIPYGLPPVGPFRFRRPRNLPACYRYGTKANPGVFTGGAGICPQPGYLQDDAPETWDEDCLQLNIWKPTGPVPERGWPVLFFIRKSSFSPAMATISVSSCFNPSLKESSPSNLVTDGGWLQHGSPNSNNAAALLGETAGKCIIVMPAYRLNVFGFIASRELEDESGNGIGSAGNYGFWDQRLALDWTRRRIAYFDGDPTNITVSGYSAGSHSAFHQLAHDLLVVSKSQRIIRRAIMFSNGPGVQPKSMPLAQTQFESLLHELKIPSSIPASEKLARLRSAPAASIVTAAARIDLHEFRATTDGAFIQKTLFEAIDDGRFASRMKEHGVELLIGECRDEHFVYESWRPPKKDTYDSFRTRLLADYPAEPLDAVLNKVYCPDKRLPTVQGVKCKNWSDAFGRVYAELQVHALERGFVENLHAFGAGDLVSRYRIEWRAECCDATFPKEWGVTHGTDMALWFWGNGIGGKGLNEKEKQEAQVWLKPFWGWLEGEGMRGWGTNGVREVRRLKSDGNIDTWKDDLWDTNVWRLIRSAADTQTTRL